MLPALPLLLTVGSSLVNIGGQFMSRPKRRNFSAAKLFPNIQRGILQNTEAITAPIRQSAGESAAARGLTGGAGAQVVAQAEAPVRAQAARDMNDAYTQLQFQEEQSGYEDEMAQRQWRGQLFGDIAGAGAALGQGMYQQQSDDRLLDILSGGGTQTAQPSSGGRLFGIRNPKITGTMQSGQARQRNAGAIKGGIFGGLNAASPTQTLKRRRVANQYSGQRGYGMSEYFTGL